jgi:tRNA 2-selenouridine synthase
MPRAINKLPADEFLKLSANFPVIDVRSPGEYACGHIPGAVNIPLFDDSQRAEVGTLYKQEGNLKAVLRGIDLAAPEMSAKLEAALDLACDGRVLVHCWRGGMRSEAMAWLFSMGGITASVLEGGYKSYRNFILEELARPRRYILLGGLTGSGKTHILQRLASGNHQVADLEALASHKGSAFGALGQPAQPTSEHFANLLHSSLCEMNTERFIWLEDESRNIGTVFLPDGFYGRMQESPVVALMMSIETRMPRLLEEYSAFPPELIRASVLKISKRLGGEKTREAIAAVERNDFSTAIRITLEYYDRAYSFGLSKRKSGKIVFVDTETDDTAVNAGKVLDAAAAFN